MNEDIIAKFIPGELIDKLCRIAEGEYRGAKIRLELRNKETQNRSFSWMVVSSIEINGRKNGDYSIHENRHSAERDFEFLKKRYGLTEIDLMVDAL